MNYFHNENEPVYDGTTRLVIEVASLVIRRFRAELRQRQTAGLTFTQVRALGFVQANPAASLSDAAEYLGLQAPTTSKVVEELVQRGLVRRDAAESDRRRVTLHTTPEGDVALEAALAPARARVAELFAPLHDDERTTVHRAMELLHPLLVPGGAERKEREP